MTENSNPYEFPRYASVSTKSADPFRLIFFLVNFGIAVALGLACVIAIAQSMAGGGSPFDLLGGLCCIGPTFAIAAGEWFLFVRKREKLRRPLGFACGAVATFALFGIVANAFEAFVEGDPPPMVFWLIFGSISLAISSYGFFCCWYRLRDRRRQETSQSLHGV